MASPMQGRREASSDAWAYSACWPPTFLVDDPLRMSARPGNSEIGLMRSEVSAVMDSWAFTIGVGAPGIAFRERLEAARRPR